MCLFGDWHLSGPFFSQFLSTLTVYPLLYEKNQYVLYTHTCPSQLYTLRFRILQHWQVRSVWQAVPGAGGGGDGVSSDGDDSDGDKEICEGLCAVEDGQEGRAILAFSLGPRQTGLAYRVFSHGQVGLWYWGVGEEVVWGFSGIELGFMDVC